jgi:hypothetical protein
MFALQCIFRGKILYIRRDGYRPGEDDFESIDRKPTMGIFSEVVAR